MKTAAPNEPLNLTINVLAITLWGVCLYVASHASEWWQSAVAALVFSYVANTLFAFLHESVHRVYSLKPWLNETMGWLNGALFPTGLTFQRVCHLGHHLRNRTDHEMFDMYYPDDNLFMKRAQFYSILTGIYWITIPLGWFVYLICPWSYRLLKSESVTIKRTGAIMLHPFIDHPKKWRIRLELFAVIVLWFGIFQLLDLSFWPTFGCYWLFGMVWGSLQYADHAWSPRDVLRGAWNLKVNGITRLFFLNYHYHQVHHIHPKLPWNHLPKHVAPESPRPTFWKVYFEMWKGPRPADAPSPAPIAEVERALSDDEDLRTPVIETQEMECLRQFVAFTRRHRRYGLIAVVLYALTLKDRAMARRLRHGFCALQLIDDLLDGDRPCVGEPADIVRAALAAFENGQWDESPLHRLLRSFLTQITDLPQAAELRRLIPIVCEAMLFDRARVRDRLQLDARALAKQHHATFSASLDLVLAVIGGNLRSGDVPAILDVFGWCSMLRDLEEDLSKGLCNIPTEVWGGKWPGVKPDPHWMSDKRVQAWLALETESAVESMHVASERLATLPADPGKVVFNLFLRSMHRYAKKGPHVAASLRA